MIYNISHFHFTKGEKMKGIILAGGAGTRLGALTLACSKQLLPIYNRPVIYHPLCTLMQGGIRDILIITTPRDILRVRDLLGDGSQWGISISYRMQHTPSGIAEAFLIASECGFICSEPVTLILGDNLFIGTSGLGHKRWNIFLKDALRVQEGARVFVTRVINPCDYGVAELGEDNTVVSLEEKPAEPKSNWAVVGLYVYDKDVVSIARRIERSARGELEITDVNKEYLRRGKLSAAMITDAVWMDVGTPDRLLDAGLYARSVEQDEGVTVGCPVTIAKANKWV